MYLTIATVSANLWHVEESDFITTDTLKIDRHYVFITHVWQARISTDKTSCFVHTGYSDITTQELCWKMNSWLILDYFNTCRPWYFQELSVHTCTSQQEIQCGTHFHNILRSVWFFSESFSTEKNFIRCLFPLLRKHSCLKVKEFSDTSWWSWFNIFPQLICFYHNYLYNDHSY